MKTTLLKKIRNLHRVYFDSDTKKYRYETTNGKMCMGDIWEYDYQSEWVDNYESLLEKRRELIIKDAKSYFFTLILCYRRKRPQKVYRYL